MSEQKPVKQLQAEVARKIAAGEVIDRPNAILRELLDNAIDSFATEIHVEINSGGIEKVRVVDNGCGMTKEDLKNCARPHATSKIETETDLLKLSTLGFRGEALSSIAAVCRLSIISGGYKMRASVTEDHIIEQVANTKGTIVQAEGLFENFPARRRFLKRPASEMIMCKNTFIEKTLPRPDILFTFTVDDKRKITLEKNVTLTKRFIQSAFPTENQSLFYEIKSWSNENNWSFSIIIGEPSISRTNKKDIFIFVNGRRITEYSLVQAIEYGCQGFFPNGTFPVAALFVNMKSELVDFNIHPAKKEARFYDISELHHAVSTAVRNFFHQYTLREIKNINKTEDTQSNLLTLFEEKNNFNKDNTTENKSYFNSKININNNYSKHADDFSRIVMHKGKDNFSSPFAKSSVDKSFQYSTNHTEKHIIKELSQSAIESDVYIEENANIENDFKFLGSTLGTFIVAEKNNALYIIDKHAAHERILFDEIMSNQGKSQKLLIPYEIHTQSRQDDIYLTKIKDVLLDVGITMKNKGSGIWEISSVPERWKGSEADFYHLLLDSRISPNEIISKVVAMTACKAAVKDGYTLDDNTAKELAKKALELDDPHCPHGRPVWVSITRGELFTLVKRTGNTNE